MTLRRTLNALLFITLFSFSFSGCSSKTVELNDFGGLKSNFSDSMDDKDVTGTADNDSVLIRVKKLMED
jgi:hypothetical protein